MYRYVIRPLLFLLPSETAHTLAMRLLVLLTRVSPGRWCLRRLFSIAAPGLHRHLLGLDFPNPLGIAAGFDKNGTYIAAMAALGFGFIEVGTITPRAQRGNPRPRLFRLKASHALINRMGFNNDGCIAIAHRLQKYRRRKFVLGANIGKNKDTPNDQASDDYLACFDTLHPYVDYFVINVSSPNTPGLRDLQERRPLSKILSAVIQRNADLHERKPLLLKIAPDLTDEQLKNIVALVQEMQIDGIVVTNTTVSREGLRERAEHIKAIGDGGLSGAPLRSRAQEVLQLLHTQLPEKAVLVGVGGIDSAESAAERMAAGASLLQIYTGFIYQGPGLIKRILRKMDSTAK